MAARTTFVGCHTPHMVHPTTLLGLRNVIGINEQTECADRDTIYLVLRNGSGASNPGRRITNHAAMDRTLFKVARELSAILETNLRVALLNVKQLPSELMKDLRRARLVIGPHGGGMYNSIFAPRYTAVLEVWVWAEVVLRVVMGCHGLSWVVMGCHGLS
jgi:capsular polysaccharide biosynthesis protein